MRLFSSSKILLFSSSEIALGLGAPDSVFMADVTLAGAGAGLQGKAIHCQLNTSILTKHNI